MKNDQGEAVLTKNGELKPTGCHHAPEGVLPIGWQAAETSSKDANGVYEANKLTYTDPEGRTGQKKTSTMFPDNWPFDQVKTATTEAWNDPSGSRGPNNRWSGETKDGLRIDGFYNKDTGECITAWPRYRYP